jgi:hypothetical protein
MGRKKPDLLGHFLDDVGEPLKKSVLLRDHSNFKIGGKADYFFEATSIPGLPTLLLEGDITFSLMMTGFVVSL